MQDVTNPVSLSYFYCMWDIPVLLDSVQYFLIYHTIDLTDLLHSSPTPHFNIYKRVNFSVKFCQYVKNVDKAL
jgi:hypothetical protein